MNTLNRQQLMPSRLLARRLRVPASWLQAEAESGNLPHLKAGDRFLFDAALVEGLLLERARQGKAVNDAR